MNNNYRVERIDQSTWMVKNDNAERIPGIDEKCNVEYLQTFLDKRIPGYKVTKAEICSDGIYVAPPTTWFTMTNTPGMENTGDGSMPVDFGQEFCNIEVHRAVPDGDQRISFALPTVWNGRLFSPNTGGVYTDPMWMMTMTPFVTNAIRVAMPQITVRNGFATAWTNSGIRESSLIWNPVNPETGAFDGEMLRRYDYLGKHYSTVIAKLLIEALTGQGPDYSYAEGYSGGGRLQLRTAQRCPEDFDGIWADGPYCPYHRTSAVVTWAMVAMKDNDDYLPYAKLDAFREAVLARYGGLEGWLEQKDRTEFDALECVGTETEAGVITETDAKVMNMVWDGPRRKDGTLIHRGPRPGAKFWINSWLNYIYDDNGIPVDCPEYDLGHHVYARWVARDPEWDWHSVTLDNFEAWYDSYYAAFAAGDMLDDDVDYRRLVHAGTKFIIGCGTEDEFCPIDGLIDYYNEIGCVTFNGDKDEMKKHIRLFAVPGNDHLASIAFDGIGPALSDAIMALMKWVEQGEAPDAIPAELLDFMSSEVLKSGEVYAY